MQEGPGHPQAPRGPQERRAFAVMHACPDAIVCVDEQGRVVDFNPAAGPLLELLYAPTIRADLERVIATGATLRSEHALTGGTEVEATITPHDPADGCAATLFLRDVTASKRSERLRAAEHRLARILTAARTGTEVAQEVLEIAAVELGFDHAELWITDRESETQRLFREWRPNGESPFADAARRLTVVRGSDLAGLAWEIGETVCVDDVQQLEGLPRAEAARAEGIRGCAAVPMRAGSDVQGVAVFARVGGEPLDPELRQTLHSICAQLCHFAERRTAERQLARETVALAAVARATRRVTDAVDAATARQAIVEAAIEVSGADHAFVALPDPNGRGLAVRYASPPLAEGVDPVFRYDGDSKMIEAYDSGEPVFFADAEDTPGVDDRARDVGVRAGLLQPIRRGPETIGVLGIGWSEPMGIIDTAVLELIEMLAGEAAMAISRVELVTQLEAAARTDPLTGLANVRAWDEQLTRELAAARRDNRPVAVAVLDLDGFKALNDKRGHQHGDRVLRTVAAGWVEQLRQGDMLARLGGDEFAALLPGCRPDDARVLAERLRVVTEDITVSIGVAYWDGEEAPSQLRGRADAALYAAKAAGRDRVWSG